MVAEGGEGENPLLSPLQPQNVGGVGGGGRGGIPFVSLQVPTSEAAVSADTHFARLPPRGLRNNLKGLGGFCGEKAPGPWWAGPQALGARAPSPLETWPTGPWGLDPATFTDFLQAKFNFLLRLKPMRPGLKTLP